MINWIGLSFFFSSRRRHTRYWRDWSSDVCSSDLGLTIELREFPEGTRTAEDAARAIGVEVGQIVKSLVFTLDGALVMALVSGRNRLDEARLAAALGGREVRRTDAAGVREATGYAIGGVPPFGHPEPLPTAIDEDLLPYAEV